MRAARWFSAPASPSSSALYFWTDVSRVPLFWAAFILTRPLGATVGDFLDKPVSHGGLALSRPLASGASSRPSSSSASWLPQRAGRIPARIELSRNLRASSPVDNRK